MSYQMDFSEGGEGDRLLIHKKKRDEYGFT